MRYHGELSRDIGETLTAADLEAVDNCSRRALVEDEA
jgi:hypothetical protein